MGTSIYLINPKSGAHGHYGKEANRHYSPTRTVVVADLACATVAVLIPDDFEVETCGEKVIAVDLDHPGGI